MILGIPLLVQAIRMHRIKRNYSSISITYHSSLRYKYLEIQTIFKQFEYRGLRQSQEWSEDQDQLSRSSQYYRV